MYIVSQNFGAKTEDLRGNVSGDAEFSDLTASVAMATFDLSDPRPSNIMTHVIDVRAADADELEATASLMVEIHLSILAILTTPTICLIKP